MSFITNNQLPDNLITTESNAWHGQQNRIDDLYAAGEMTAHEILIEAFDQTGISTPVRKKPVTVAGGGKIPGYMATIREGSTVPMGIVRSDYRVLQDTGEFGVLEPPKEVVNEFGLKIATCGTFDDGATSWVQFKIDGTQFDVTGGDRVDPLFMLLNNHVGALKATAGGCMTRAVCTNTISYAYREAKGKGLNLKHTKRVTDERVAEYRTAVGEAIRVLMGVQDFYQASAQVQVNEAAWLKLLDYSVGAIKQVEDGARTNSRLQNRRDFLTGLFDGGAIGTEFAGQSAWGALNAFSEFDNHHAGVKRRKGMDESAWTEEAQNAARWQNVLLNQKSPTQKADQFLRVFVQNNGDLSQTGDTLGFQVS